MFKDLEFSTKDYAIGGKLCCATITISDMEMIDDKEFIKNRLASELTKFILEQNLVEFTQMLDPVTFGTKIRARVYLTPNEQIKIVRTMIK